MHILTPVVLIACTTCAQAQTPVVVSDLTRLKTISSVDVAPDGSYCVYVVRAVVEDEDGHAYRNQIWRVELDGDPNPRALTTGSNGASSPAISPDGRSLAFVRAGDESTSQIWLMPMDTPGEAVQLTTLEHGASRPTWRPDGEVMLVSSSIPAAEMEGAPTWDDERVNRAWADAAGDDETSPDGDLSEVRRWLASNAAKQDPHVITRLDFQGERGLQGPMRFTQVFTVDVDSREATQVTSGFQSHSGAIWSPNGQAIYFTSDGDSDAHPDRVVRNALWRMTADGSDMDMIGDAAQSVRAPAFGEDGVLRAVCTDADDALYAQSEVFDIDGQHNRTDGWDAPVSSFWAMSDGSLVVTGPWHGSFPIVMIGDDGQIVPVDLEHNAGVRSMDVDGGRIVAAVTSVSHPARLVAIGADSQERVLHDPNAWVQQRRLSMPTEHWIERDDGTLVQYWVMAPEGDGPHKTVLAIHGGPAAMWGPGEFTMWHEFQLLCAWGYAVVYSNPRGSSGYGYDFKRANEQDWGAGPAGDVLACLDDAVSRYSWIDEDRLVVTGGSYAGYLTAWIVAHDHRFKAALAQRGVYDLSTFFGEGNAWRLVPWAMGGYPWNDEASAVLDRESPFSYVDQIETPLLILHASQDLRTGVSQSEMLYRALKVLGRPVEYVRYPNAGHDLSRTGDPTQRMDRLLRIVEWFERFVGDDQP